MSLLKAGHSLSCVPLCALQAEVQPQCGRAVGFSSGTENPHGVKAVTRGQRCAIALWFTLDARHSERVRAAGAAVTWKGPCSASASPGALDALGLGAGESRETPRPSAVIALPHPPWPFFPTCNGAPGGGGGKMGTGPGSWFLFAHGLSWLCPESNPLGRRWAQRPLRKSLLVLQEVAPERG